MRIGDEADLQGVALLAAYDSAKAADPRLTHSDFARRMGLPVQKYFQRRYKAMQDRHGIGSAFDDFPFTLGEPFRLRGDVMIVGDVHVPFTDMSFAPFVAEIAKRHMPRPRQLLIAGDLFNMDSFSSYAALIEHPSWKQERDFARNLLRSWRKIFDKVWVIMGNHERRLQKWTQGAFDETDLMALIWSDPDWISMSPFGYCTVESEFGDWLVTHPRNYSINQLTVADALAQKHRMNIISHHEHHFAKGWDRYGWNVIVNNGTLIDPERVPYVTLDNSKSAGMKHGFVALVDGVPHMFGREPFTSWNYWLTTKNRLKARS